MAKKEPTNPRPKSTEHPSIRPTFRWRPDRVRGIPICRESRAFIPEMPTALFQEKENPYLRLLLRAIGSRPLSEELSYLCRTGC